MRCLLSCFSLLFFMVTAASAFDGMVDESFGTNGWTTVAFDEGNQNDKAYAVTVDPDGRIYLAGATSSDIAQFGAFGVARLLPNGQVDIDGYGVDGKVNVFMGEDGVFNLSDAELQTNGKLVVVGAASFDDSHGVFTCRLNTEGSLDPAYGDPSTPGCRLIDLNSSTYSASPRVVIQRNGKIVIGVRTRIAEFNLLRSMLVRLDANGDFDPSFGDGGLELPGIEIVHPEGGDAAFSDVAETPDGDLIVVALINQLDTWRFYRIRGQDGDLDTESFGASGIRDIEFYSNDVKLRPGTAHLIMMPHGKIRMAGSGVKGVLDFCSVATQLTAEGSIDGFGFGNGGRFVDSYCARFRVKGVVMQSDDKMILIGPDQNYFGMMRLKSDGVARDLTFGNGSGYYLASVDGGISSLDATASAMQGGRVLVAGEHAALATPDFIVTRLENELIFTDDLE